MPTPDGSALINPEELNESDHVKENAVGTFPAAPSTQLVVNGGVTLHEGDQKVKGPRLNRGNRMTLQEYEWKVMKRGLGQD